jgi:hypothetical protein
MPAATAHAADQVPGGVDEGLFAWGTNGARARERSSKAKNQSLRELPAALGSQRAFSTCTVPSLWWPTAGADSPAFVGG